MANLLPTPVAAALGIVPAVLDHTRRLPGKAVRFPLVALSTTLATVDALRREYEDLAERGERLARGLRGGAQEATDATARAGQQAAGDLAGGVRRATTTATDAATSAAATAATATATVASGFAPAATQPATSPATPTAPAPAIQTPEAEQPKGVATPQETRPDSSRVDTAASPSVVQVVEQATAAVGSLVLAHDDLPLPDYDHMTLGSLRGRLRSLSLDQLVQIRTYEKAHADRLPVVTMLDNRIAKLATDPSEAPSGPVSTEPAPEQRSGAPAAPSVSPATTNAPPINPPSHGDPTNPSQPR